MLHDGMMTGGTAAELAANGSNVRPLGVPAAERSRPRHPADQEHHLGELRDDRNDNRDPAVHRLGRRRLG
jgi:hypothetical protein